MNTNHFKEKLEAEKKTLETELGQVGKKDARSANGWEARPTETGMEPDVVDQADTIQSFETNEAIERDLNMRYQEVTAALERIDAGTYGTCGVCGEPIEEARLEADPAAATCKAHL